MAAWTTSPESILTTHALDTHQHAEFCKNCDAATSGNYCHQCGQATHLHVPSAREFLHEFVSHYVALEGKLWRSLKLLFLKPGLLTREYIEGRRVRYVEPLRLYLTFSIIFFALFKLSGVEIYTDDSAGAAAPAAIHAPASSAPPPAAAAAGASVELNERERELVREFGALSPRLGAGAENFLRLMRVQQNEAVKRAFYGYTPYAIFLLMPVFALFLKLLYLGSGRRYGEHFLFALHSNAFAFFTMSLFIVADGWDFVRFLLLVWLIFYLPTAMRRVYGGDRRSTALRWIVLLALHLLSLAMAVVVVALLGMVLSS
jgi:hypothetical protein